MNTAAVPDRAISMHAWLPARTAAGERPAGRFHAARIVRKEHAVVGVIATGHSHWDPQAPDPHVTVPPDTKIYFYQEPLHLLADEVGSELERLNPEALAGHVGHAGPGEPVRNYTLSYPDRLDFARVPPGHPDFRQLIPPEDRPYRLAEVLREFAGHEIYWAACLAVKLNRVGGEFTGVNTGWSGQDRQGDGRSTGRYRSEADLQAAVDADPAKHPSTKSALYAEALLRAALPEHAKLSDVLWPMSMLTEKSGEPVELAAAFAALLPDERRGVLLSDTLRWWLADHGVHAPGHVNDELVAIDDAVFWLARPEIDLKAHNHAVLWSLQPDEPARVLYYVGVDIVVGTELPSEIKRWCEAKQRHGVEPLMMTVVPVVVDRHVTWVLHGCPQDTRADVHQALVLLGAEDVWFDREPARVFEANVFADLVRTNAEEFRTLDTFDAMSLMVNDRHAVFGWGAPQWLYHEIRDGDHHCDGLLTVVPAAPGSIEPGEYVVTGVATGCTCRSTLDTMIEIVRGETGSQIPSRYE